MRMPDSGNDISISPLSPFPPVQPQTHEPTLRVPSSARSAMFIVTPTPDAQAKLLWERHEWRFASHSPSVVGPSTRTHAAPLELGGPGGICGYKHAAPKGALPRRACLDAGCKILIRSKQRSCGAFSVAHSSTQRPFRQSNGLSA